MDITIKTEINNTIIEDKAIAHFLCLREIHYKYLKNNNNETYYYNDIKRELIFFINSGILYDTFKYIKTMYFEILDTLKYNILKNTPYANITKITFNNIKTELFPYQINNVNWMINIENKIYTEQFNDIIKKLDFKGGGLFDEVSMGKTLQTITLINNNKSTYKKYLKNQKLYSKASLLIIPNHLCKQWVREFEKHQINKINIIELLTKHHYKKYSYYELINADVVIVSSSFFTNCDLDLTERINYLTIIKNIFNKNVNIYNIFWHRVIIDEFHEITENKLFHKLKKIESDNRWIISGTPIKDGYINTTSDYNVSSLKSILDYLTFNEKTLDILNIANIDEYNYVLNHFSRNLHINNVKILKLPTIEEEIVWLEFTENERLLYNGYVADENNDKSDEFLRQLCCHPMICDKIRTSHINNQDMTLQSMQDTIKKIYFGEFENANEKYLNCTNKIYNHINEIEIMKKNNKTDLKGYQVLVDELEKYKGQEIELKKIKDGKENALMYYKKFIEIISDVDKLQDEDCPICLDKINLSNVGISTCSHMYCYTCIKTVIDKTISKKCPLCNKNLCTNDIYVINEKPKIIENKTTDIDDKLSPNVLGTKLSYIIKYINKTKNKYRIIFSQWDYLLKQVGKVLSEHGIKHLYCSGNIYQKDKMLKLFNSDCNNNDENEYKIIMMSSEHTISGSNLNNAEEVIFLDPFYGTKKECLNMENQAIGRLRRLGNKFLKIKVLKLLIKNTIEEDIYNYSNNQNINN
jgi:SNF2 family DNA or RNA helicase